MANQKFTGFRPVDGKNWRCRRYSVADSYDGPINGLFPGDPVILVTAGTLEHATAGATNIVGVVRSISYVSNSVRIDGKYLPDVHTYSPTARGSVNEPWIYVWDDPLCEYVASGASHAGSDTAAELHAARGANMDLATLTNGSQYYGWSGAQLDGNPIAATAQFRIEEILRRPGNDTAAVDWMVRCSVNEGFHATLDNAGI